MTFCFGGDKRDRTADLMTASHALSQLSYTPIGEVILSDPAQKSKCFLEKIFLCGIAEAFAARVGILIEKRSVIL